MALTSAGLPNQGRTRYYNVFYDDTLSAARGHDAAVELMRHIDGDFELAATWFPGVQLGTPMNVNITHPTDDAKTGASWQGWGLVPVGIDLKLGEFPVDGPTFVETLRYLLVLEVSEVFMRDRQPAFFNRFNDWFEAFNEGSKGESLSLLLGVEFLRRQLPHVTLVPAVAGRSFRVAQLWLNSSRPDHVDDNVGTTAHDVVTGCGTLFLFFLADQLGFSITEIIGAGSAKLSGVYAKLTGDLESNAFTTFSALVEQHYPAGSDSYEPPLESIFPVPDLSSIFARSVMSWVTNYDRNDLTVSLTHQAKTTVRVALESDAPGLVDVPSSVVVPVGSFRATVPVTVSRPAGAFTPRTATITARYAGMVQSIPVTIVAPGDLPMPELQIVPQLGADICAQSYVEGSTLQFAIPGLDTVFIDPAGLKVVWTATGATVPSLTGPTLSIPSLPPAGTAVTVTAVATTASGLRARGSTGFTSVAPLGPLDLANHRVRCIVGRLQWQHKFLPPWIPVEKPGVLITPRELAVLEKQASQMARELHRVASVAASARRAQAAQKSGRSISD